VSASYLSRNLLGQARTVLCLASAALLVCGAEPPSPGALADTEIVAGFKSPPPEARTRLFWRVFGPAWTAEEIDYQLDLLKNAGVGGVTAFFMYPVALDRGDVHTQRFLSDEFLRTLEHAAVQAKKLGLRFGVAGGTGWPFGGPMVSPNDAAQQLRQVTIPAPLPGDAPLLPPLRAGEQILAVFSGTNDITDHIVGARSQLLPAEAQQPLRFFVTGPTGMLVKRAAVGERASF